MNRKILIAVIVIATFVLADMGRGAVDISADRESLNYLILIVLNRAFWYILLPLIVVGVLHKTPKVFAEIGLNGDLLNAGKIAGLATLPMLVGYGYSANFAINLNLDTLVLGVVMAALAEEVYFRGFLFGQLYRRVGLWFIVAAGSSAIVFGVGHLYQGNGLVETAGVFLVTLIGGIWFSWLFKRWSFNLWVPILFHLLMNLYWSMFDAGDNALGGIEANLYRVMTIGLSIWLTLRWTGNQSNNTMDYKEAVQ